MEFIQSLVSRPDRDTGRRSSLLLRGRNRICEAGTTQQRAESKTSSHPPGGADRDIAAMDGPSHPIWRALWPARIHLQAVANHRTGSTNAGANPGPPCTTVGARPGCRYCALKGTRIVIEFVGSVWWSRLCSCSKEEERPVHAVMMSWTTGYYDPLGSSPFPFPFLFLPSRWPVRGESCRPDPISVPLSAISGSAILV